MGLFENHLGSWDFSSEIHQFQFTVRIITNKCKKIKEKDQFKTYMIMVTGDMISVGWTVFWVTPIDIANDAGYQE